MLSLSYWSSANFLIEKIKDIVHENISQFFVLCNAFIVFLIFLSILFVYFALDLQVLTFYPLQRYFLQLLCVIYSAF